MNLSGAACVPGGLVAERMIGWSVTTLTKIETIQKLEKMAHFWINGIGAIATGVLPAEAVAGSVCASSGPALPSISSNETEGSSRPMCRASLVSSRSKESVNAGLREKYQSE